ncbi:Cruciform DNA binding protein [Cryomyces antarcticus]|uniref:Cruciform DNA binding protein n=1 Tax=Cryomyces antarcticus TaxID=329879 RepID=A0ABR0M993_9PEZI|nr:Cruciform DNA binding protein [Cryomyces antarcticus]KAK5020338.1 Cruciform DNA binding protein [Cryomyces antarcticus]KAK5296646.1 Cruciform DNA binding protein [Cryomyces antarcticus]
MQGTFDDWAKSEKLERKGDHFEKTVQLAVTNEKIYYKFVVDGNWTTDHTAPSERDGAYNVNNILLPEEIQHPSPTAHTMSSAAPQSSTAALVGAQPSEKSASRSSMPGGFPVTPGTEPSSFSVNPIPASSGAGNPIHLTPGESVPDPGTFNSNTISSTARDDPSLMSGTEESQQTFGVAPIPATAGAGNPIHLAPGDKVPDPSTLTANTINSTVRTDAASYEKSDSGAPQLPPVLTPKSLREADGADMFGLGPSTGNMIPESSLPMGGGSASRADPGYTIQSAAPTSTTAQLAGQVPLEHRGVSTVVTESQHDAHVDPEASASPEAVTEKKEVEQELLEKVPEQPAAAESGVSARSADSTAQQKSESSMSAGKIAGLAAGAAATMGAGVASAAYAVKDKTVDTAQAASGYGGILSSLPASVQSATSSMNLGAGTSPPTFTSSQDHTARGVPETVSKSIEQAHQSPEAAANPEAVSEKQVMEDELLRKIPSSEASGEHAPSSGGDATALVGTSTAPGVPETVSESIQRSHQSPEAAANPEAVTEKQTMEDELLRKIPSAQDTGEHAPSFGGGAMALAGGAAALAGGATALAYRSTGHGVSETGGHAASLAAGSTAQGVPETVAKSIQRSHESPEAAANPEAVTEKQTMEDELLRKVPSTQESGEHAPRYAPATIPAAAGTSRSATGVPEVVTESIEKAHVSPEAVANPEAVTEKSAVERELLKEVKPTNESGAPAPSDSAALSAIAPIKPTTSETTSALSPALSPSSMSDDRPLQSSTELANPASYTSVPLAGTTSGLNAPKEAPARTGAVEAAQLSAPRTPVDSRDVSPMSRGATNTTSQQTQPTVTTGVGSAKTEETSAATPQQPSPAPATSSPAQPNTLSAGPATPQKSFSQRAAAGSATKGTPDSNRTSMSGTSVNTKGEKKKRHSFFGKLKEKFSSHDKK